MRNERQSAFCFSFSIHHSSFHRFPSFILKTMIQQMRVVEHAHDGTRHRIIECRRRLRKVRVVQRALRLAHDGAVIAATEVLALGTTATDFADAEEMFEEASASFSREISLINARG